MPQSIIDDYIIDKKCYNILYQYINHSYCVLNNYKSIINKLFQMASLIKDR